MLAFYPAEGHPEVQIVNVGVATNEGFPLERAALSMHELQEPEMVDGEPTGERIPLTGDKLISAAQAWAKSAGLIVADHEGTIPADPSVDEVPPMPAETVPPTPGMGDASPQPPIPAGAPADSGVNAPFQEA